MEATEGFKGGPQVSHIKFANDLLFFANASMDQVEVIKNSLASLDKSFQPEGEFL